MSSQISSRFVLKVDQIVLLSEFRGISQAIAAVQKIEKSANNSRKSEENGENFGHKLGLS